MDESELAPYLDLARAIRAEVDRFTSDEQALAGALEQALDTLTDGERARVAWTAFERLSAERQLELLERLLGPARLVGLLTGELADRAARHDDQAAAEATRARAVRGNRLDLTALDDGDELTIGLFRAEDVSLGMARGRASERCARELELLAVTEPGWWRVVRDTYNPRGGMVVTGAYDRSVWEAERLESHRRIMVGSAAEGESFEQVLYHGARVDLLVGDVVHCGRLHLGWAAIGPVEAFARKGAP